MGDNNKISLKDSVSIGIGGMVGGGIFAVLGLAVSLAKGGTPLAFLFAGILALLTSYSYVKLSLAFPDRGGTVKFINQGFNRKVFSGGINNLLWVSYIVMLSLYASAFGSYAPNLLEITGEVNIDNHLYASAVILGATLINYYSIKVVGEIESFAVIAKLVILLGFIGVGVYGLFGNENLSQLEVSQWENPIQLVAAGMVIFVAYEGFELIANAVPDLRDPKRDVPRAYYISVGFVLLLYIVIAAVTVGSLPFNVISEAQDYVLAEAAKPQLGQVGFSIMTAAALLSTFSAINASLYGGSRVSYEISEDDELPHQLSGKLWNQPVGLLITAIGTLLLTNTLELSSISTAGSVGFLLVFAAVNAVSFKCAAQIDSVKWISLTGCILCLVALFIMLKQQLQQDLTGVIIAISVIVVCFLAEWIFKRWEKRKRQK